MEHKEQSKEPDVEADIYINQIVKPLSREELRLKRLAFYDRKEIIL